MSNSLLNIIYETAGICQNRYISKIKYGDFDLLIIEKSNDIYEVGMINVTKMCQSQNKQFKHWNENKSSKEFLEFVSQKYEHPLQIVLRGSSPYVGTYIHQDILPHIAMWISNSFAYKVSQIINNEMCKGYEKTIDDLKQQLQTAITVLQQTHAEMGTTETKIDNILNKVVDIADGVFETNERLIDISDKAFEAELDLNSKLNIIAKAIEDNDQKLNDALENKTLPPTTPSKTECLIVLRLDQPAFSSHYISRCQFGNVSDVLKREKGVIIFQIANPNARHLFNCIKHSELPGVTYTLNNFNVKDEASFLRNIQNIIDEQPIEIVEIEYTPRHDYTKEILSHKTIPELIKICKELGIRGYSNLKKQALINYILMN